MFDLYPIILLISSILYVNAIPEQNPGYYGDNWHFPTPIGSGPVTKRPRDWGPLINRPTFNPDTFRFRRFTDGSQRFDGQNPQDQNQKWEVKPDLSRDKGGNIKSQVTIQKHGENHDFEAGWGKTIRGSDKHSETWHAGDIKW